MKDINKNEVIRALWWKQPYASAMLVGKIETRTWPTKVRGKVLICASAKSYSNEMVNQISGIFKMFLLSDLIRKLLPSSVLDVFITGHAIAIGDLVDCRPMTKDDEEKCFVQYREGLWCHVYENVQAIKPFPLKGCQGWRILSEEQKGLIELL